MKQNHAPLIITLIVLVVVAVVFFASMYYSKPVHTPVVTDTSAPSYTKEAILKRIADTKPLSKTEKQAIAQSLSPATVSSYHLSNEEMGKILNVLNTK